MGASNPVMLMCGKVTNIYNIASAKYVTQKGDTKVLTQAIMAPQSWKDAFPNIACLTIRRYTVMLISITV